MQGSCLEPLNSQLNAAWWCRGYHQKKIAENVECEIMHVIVEEARESYRWAKLAGIPPFIILEAGKLTQRPILQRPILQAMWVCREEIVQVLPSDSLEDLERNVTGIVAWVNDFYSL